MMINHLIFFLFTYFWSLGICHIWYRFSIDTEVLQSGIVPKQKLWYRVVIDRYRFFYYRCQLFACLCTR